MSEISKEFQETIFEGKHLHKETFDECMENTVNSIHQQLEDHTIKYLTIDMQLTKNAKPIQRKGRPVVFHFQNTIRNELERLVE